MKRSNILTLPIIRELISLSKIILLLILCLSCEDKNKNKLNNHQQNYDSQFNEIHKLVYENPSLARRSASKILKQLSKENVEAKVICLKYIGSSYAFETKYLEAITYYKKALSFAEKLNFYYEIGNLNNNLGTIYNEFGNYRAAYMYFVKALQNYDLSGHKEKKTGTLNNIGLTYLNLNHYDKALGYFKKALNSSTINNDSILTATILNNIAICNFSKKDTNRGMKNLRQSILLSEKANNLYGTCISYQIMGNTYLSLNEKSKAYNAYSKSVTIAKNAGLVHLLAVSKVGLARLALSENNVAKAQLLADEVMAVSEQNNSQSLKADALQLLASIYESRKDYKESLKYFEAHTKLKEEMTNSSIVNQIYDVEVDYLNQLNQLQTLELEKKELAISNKNIILLLMSLVFMIIFGGLYFLYRNHQNKQKVKLQETIIELNRRKSNAALEAEIRERKRIGRELHDSLGYLLSLAGLNASVLQKRNDINEIKKSELIAALMESINEAFDEVRNISHNLAPSLLSEQGIKGALKNIADKVNQSGKIKMSFDTFGLQQHLDDLIENILYRTIQEIVNNTIKHADASELFVQIAKDSHQITLISEDNGRGFDVEKLEDEASFGLAHIRSWIENLNGSMHIDSKINRGTIVSIMIPINIE